MRDKKREELIPSIIFEDEHLIVINKPAGWIVNSTSTSLDQPVIQDWLKKNFDFPIAKSWDYRSGIVHRLDKDTSGVLLIAKTSDNFEALQNLFRERKVKKRYTALVHGHVSPASGTIEVQVGRLPWNRRRFGVVPGGRDSLTRYNVDSEYSLGEKKYSLVSFFPETGRTHQIRIHAKHIGHPIVSDSFYAGRKTSRKDQLWCPRIFLHASEISFPDPVTGGVRVFSAAIPDDLAAALSILEKSPRSEVS